MKETSRHDTKLYVNGRGEWRFPSGGVTNNKRFLSCLFGESLESFQIPIL